MKKTIHCISGGRTSAYMAKLSKEAGEDAVYIFANTGEEADETLDFINKVDKEFGLNLVWVELDIKSRKEKTHKIVNCETATRWSDPIESKPFYKMCEFYGVPNKAYPHCTRELKEYPIDSYLKNELGLAKSEYTKAIGIRADEPKRIKGGFYPLVELGVTKGEVLDFWKNFKFDLQLKEREGNCVFCFKKSQNKLIKLINSDRVIHFETADRIEKDFGFVGPNRILGKDRPTKPRTLYRGYMSTEKLKVLAKFADPDNQLDMFDNDNICGDECRPFAND